MSPKVLNLILNALNANGEAEFSREEVEAWPEGDLTEALREGLLEGATPADEIVCPGCEEACLEAVEFNNGEKPEDTRAYVICGQRDDIGRVPIPLEMLDRWAVNRARLKALGYLSEGPTDTTETSLEENAYYLFVRVPLSCSEWDGMISEEQYSKLPQWKVIHRIQGEVVAQRLLECYESHNVEYRLERSADLQLSNRLRLRSEIEEHKRTLKEHEANADSVPLSVLWLARGYESACEDGRLLRDELDLPPTQRLAARLDEAQSALNPDEKTAKDARRSDAQESTSKSQPWSNDAPEYIPNSEAIKLTEGKLTLSQLSKLLKPDGPIRYMRQYAKSGKPRRCNVHVGDFRKYVKTLGADMFSDEASEAYFGEVEARKRDIRHPKQGGR